MCAACRCDLTSRLQEMTGYYVNLERAYVEWGTKKAIGSAKRIPIDETVEVFSWVDDVFFIWKKSLDRSVGTQCMLATAATLNNVYGKAVCIPEFRYSVDCVLF